MIKKKYTTLFIFLAVLTSFSLKGQNTVTLSNNDGVIGSYPTLNAAYSAMIGNSNYYSGKNVTLNVSADNTTLSAILTIGSYNWTSLTINGNGHTVNTSSYYFSITGSNVIIQNCLFNLGGATYGIYLSASKYITIQNNIFSQTPTSSASSAIYLISSPSNTRILNNEFRNMLRSSATTNVIEAPDQTANVIIISGNSFYETNDINLPVGWSGYITIGGRGTSVKGLSIKNNYFGSTAAKCAGNVLSLGSASSNVARTFSCIDTSTSDQLSNYANTNADSIVGNTFAKISMSTTSTQAPVNASEERRGALNAYYNFYAGRPVITDNVLTDFTLNGIGTNNVYLVGFGHTGSELSFERNTIKNLITTHSNSAYSGSISAICLSAVNVPLTNYITLVFKDNIIDSLSAQSTATSNAQHIIGIRFQLYTNDRYEGPVLCQNNKFTNFINSGSNNQAHFVAGFHSLQTQTGYQYRKAFIGNKIDNLKVTGSSTGTTAGIYYIKSSSSLIQDNILSNISAGTSSGTAYGLYCYGATISDTIKNNFINKIISGNIGLAYGLYSASTKALAYNNIISLCGTSSTYGIYHTGGTTSAYYHNTIIVNSSNTTSAAFYANTASTASNNIFDNRESGYGLYTTATAIVANNVYNATNGKPYSNNGVENIPASTYTNPFALQYKGGDAASICYFDTITDFQVFDFEKKYKGEQISSVTTDIGGYTRNNPAQIGAWEKIPNVWKGTNTKAWETNTNWLSESVPGTNEDIYFANDASNDLYVQGTRVQGSINRQLSSKSLVIPAGASLKVTGDMVSFNESNFIIKSEDGSNANGIFVYPQGKTVRATVEMYSKAISPETATTANEFVWQYFTSPVKTFSANNMVGSWVRQYDETESTGKWWIQLQNANNLSPFIGYEISRKTSTNPTGITRFMGELINNDQQLNVSYTAGKTFAGMLVTGNPYTAPLSIADGITFGSEMEASVYLFNTGTSSQWNGQGTSGTAEGQYLVIPQEHTGTVFQDYIPSMQGFVVKTNSSSASNITLKYTGVSNATTNMPIMRTKQLSSTTEKIYTRITLSNDGIEKDAAWIFVDENTTRGFDNGYDGRKMFGENNLAQLYMPEEDGNYQVNTIPDIDKTYLSIKGEEGSNTSYTLTFNHNGTNTRQLYLHDLSNNIITDITTDGVQYKFTTSTNIAQKRFKITTSSTPIDSDEKTNIILKYIDNKALLSNEGLRTTTVDIFDIAGRKLWTVQLASGESREIASTLIAGIYILNMTAENIKESTKIIVK